MRKWNMRCTYPSRPVTWLLAFSVILGLLPALPGCSRRPPARHYPLAGQVLAVRPDGTEITISHHDIKGFMPAMTMPFKVKEAAATKVLAPGDEVKATLCVTDDEAWLEQIEKTGHAPLPERRTVELPAVELLKPGDEVPDQTLLDQDGRAFRLSSLRGSAILLTFIYTRCPIPDFCPRMDAWFSAVQKAVKEGRIPGKVHLLSISFDPEFDTPAVLKAHAALRGADPTVWTYAAGLRQSFDPWAARLGLSVIRDATDPSDITHNLRTVIIDRHGRLVQIRDGNGWVPGQVIAALASVNAS